MKQPLMLMPPAQAEALYDAALEGEPRDRTLASLPWRDEDTPEERSPAPRMPQPHPRHRSDIRQRAA